MKVVRKKIGGKKIHAGLRHIYMGHPIIREKEDKKTQTRKEMIALQIQNSLEKFMYILQWNYHDIICTN